MTIAWYVGQPYQPLPHPNLLLLYPPAIPLPPLHHHLHHLPHPSSFLPLPLPRFHHCLLLPRCPPPSSLVPPLPPNRGSLVLPSLVPHCSLLDPRYPPPPLLLRGPLVLLFFLPMFIPAGL